MVATRPKASFTASFDSALSCSEGTNRRRRPPSNVTPTRPMNKLSAIPDTIIVAFFGYVLTESLKWKLALRRSYFVEVNAEFI